MKTFVIATALLLTGAVAMPGGYTGYGGVYKAMNVEAETMNAAKQASKMAIFEDESLQGDAETRKERDIVQIMDPMLNPFNISSEDDSQRFQRDANTYQQQTFYREAREARAAALEGLSEEAPAPKVNEYDNYDYDYQQEELVQRHQPQQPFAAAHVDSQRFRRDANQVPVSAAGAVPPYYYYYYDSKYEPQSSDSSATGGKEGQDGFNRYDTFYGDYTEEAAGASRQSRQIETSAAGGYGVPDAGYAANGDGVAVPDAGYAAYGDYGYGGDYTEPEEAAGSSRQSRQVENKASNLPPKISNAQESGETRKERNTALYVPPSAGVLCGDYEC